MHCQKSILSLAALLAVASALPLNINLGAYSPALVVGDGAIEFEGEEVENIVNALEGAAVNEAAAAAPRAVVAPAAPEGVTQASVAPLTILSDPNVSLAVPGGAKLLEDREPTPEPQPEPSPEPTTPEDIPAATKAKRDLAGFDRALQYAEAGLTKGPDVELGTGAHGAGVGIIVNNNQAGAAGSGVVVIGE
ncbi:hypothetical protein B0T25DRAFT_518482 [Lasiosphaeria hispida]|uniref:Uncharacterized protein n=1 Tax=Lasiosphaeria hispida TaxID=260671 RepID=A0AAJ0MEE9_9PEZI|nr:hypothetical protein B0T25DRAFT_518482 [Lasiosphaeria hispida]